MGDDGGYGLSDVGESREIPAPALAYLPCPPDGPLPNVALVGCGGISEYHLRAYQALGLNVVALCDVDAARAEERRAAFFPDASTYTDYRQAFARDDIGVIDAATHVEARCAIVEAALRAKKHVLSQKPFVTELAEGRRLCDLADERGVKLAVNQNGRWAPHYAYLLRAIEADLLGDVSYFNVSMQWDHTWTAGTPFDAMRHLVLYDFAIHWFDLVNAVFQGQEADCVRASIRALPVQKTNPPMLASVTIDFPNAQATLSFNGHVTLGQQDETTVCGTKGTYRTAGPSLTEQKATLYTEDGYAVPEFEGTWFENGFQGTMAELLCAIADDREPYNSARANLKSLALCFAALASADDGGAPKRPGDVHGIGG